MAMIAALAGFAASAAAQDLQTITPPSSTQSPLVQPAEQPASQDPASQAAPTVQPSASVSAAVGTSAEQADRAASADAVPVDPRALAQAAAEEVAAKETAERQAARVQARSAPEVTSASASRLDAAPASAPDAAPSAAVDRRATVAAPPPAGSPQSVPPESAAPSATGPTPVAENVAVPNANLLWIGLAGLAVVIAGGAFLMSRRRRSPESNTIDGQAPAYATQPAEAPVPAADPAVGRESAPAMPPRPVAAAATMRRNGEPGRHERAAERGPTPDNPFLTRRKRIARARFYDRRERLVAEAANRPSDMPWSRERVPSQHAATAEPAETRGATKSTGWTHGGMRPAFGNG
ncbi:hypothetical protein [Stakelama saccharophila]|uniref:LPXTG cell wall anchor domain-containing protein n=1 Tax=Stakelama saccharophila TaxID=3075605 RepID=A0ABZ0B7Q5_9SPHN|nr:hypothetical protein [Stakelama sp. W311]WNO53146.1 hypothetical protein RPR59_11910 [Stakelama sp. W311]